METAENALHTKIILFTSSKGGVGKSTVCANLAMTLSLMGKRILVIDCDFGNRCLDILLRLTDKTLYDISDVTAGRISAERAVLTSEQNSNLFFLAAPNRFDNPITAYSFRRTIFSFRDSGNYDFIFLDTPGGVGEPLLLAASVSDTAYIITSPSRPSVRAAERTASFLYQKGILRQRLIINSMTGHSIRKAKKEVMQMIESTAVRLIGVVPYDPEMVYATDNGILTDELYSHNITNAFDNIASRTLGKSVPLFRHIRKLKEID